VQLPPDGVYAVSVRLADRAYPGVANLGVRPTFRGRERLLEAHLLDFSGDLYGKRIEVELVEWIRGERRFAGVPELSRQIALDVEAARRCLSGE
jgi:riboflavin kinase/FMN adenylyltransferase